MKSFCRGIINLLFDGFTYNTRGHFAHCSHFNTTQNTTQLAKYLRVLYAKPSNKIYVVPL